MKSILSSVLKIAFWIGAVFAVGFVTLSNQSVEAQEEVPSPAAIVGSLDLSCHQAEGGGALARSVWLTHLNPVLREMRFQNELAQLGDLQQLCVPVAKNGVLPPPAVRRYVENIDLACYKAYNPEPRPVTPLKLSQLNPVLRRMGLPDHEIALGGLEQFCVPVAKNLRIPPREVLWLVQHVDVACYHIERVESLPGYPLHLSHLNPVFRAMPVPDMDVKTRLPEQLCVPIAKNGVRPPEEVLKVMQWIDFEKFEVVPAQETRPLSLILSHLNPQYTRIAPFRVFMGQVTHLNLPVAKNGVFPPGIEPVP